MKQHGFPLLLSYMLFYFINYGKVQNMNANFIPKTVNHSYSEMVENFKNPHPDCNAVLMWFWNGHITKEGITFQMEKFREQEIVNFFIHPADGISIKYLSDEFFALIKHAVREAKRLGMKYWIYDELEYPSGPVGGQLLMQYPQYSQKQIRAVRDFYDGYPGINLRAFYRGKFVGAQRVCEKDGKYFVTDVTDKCVVTENGLFSQAEYQCKRVVKQNVVFFFEEEVDNVVCVNQGEYESPGTRGYIDVLKYGAVTKFIEMAHEKYKEHLGDEFGKTVVGVFTDEPTTLHFFRDTVAGPWNEKFLKTFEEMNGYSLAPYLYALFYPPKSAAERKARSDYRETIKKLYHKNFFKQIADWCQENDLLFTGHCGGEETLGGYTGQGDMQEALMYMHIPGLDSVATARTINNYNFTIAPKLVEAAAKFAGKNHVLCETYTLSGADYRFPEMKRGANRLMTYGANMIQYMGAHYSAEGGRKPMYGTVGGYYNPIFAHYGQLGRYVASPSYLSRETVPENKVLLVIPHKEYIETAQYYPVRTEHPHIQRIYEDTVNSLLFEGIGFDLLSENLTNNFTVENGELCGFGYKYDCVVLPSMEHINGKTAALLKTLRDNNIKTVFTCSVPKYVVDEEREFDITYNFAPLGKDVLKDENAFLISQSELPLNVDNYRASLKEVIGNVTLNIKSDIRFYIAKRVNENAEVYFVTNDDKKQGKVSLDLLPGMKFLSADSREEIPFTVADNRAEFNINPFEMVVILRDVSSAELPAGINKKAPFKSVTGESEFEFKPLDGNHLPIHFEVFDKETGNWYKTVGDRGEPGHLSFADEVDLSVSEDYKIRSTFNIDVMPQRVFLNAEIYDIKSLRINGREVELTVNTKRWSQCDCKTDITSFVKTGENIIEADCFTEPKAHFAKPPYIFLSGDFILEGDSIEKARHTVKAGGFETQGFPYFTGTVLYKQSITVNDDFKRAELLIETEDACAVYVNGKYAGVKVWGYESVDITDALIKGENKIEIYLSTPMAHIFNIELVTGITAPLKIELFE